MLLCVIRELTTLLFDDNIRGVKVGKSNLLVGNINTVIYIEACGVYSI